MHFKELGSNMYINLKLLPNFRKDIDLLRDFLREVEEVSSEYGSVLFKYYISSSYLLSPQMVSVL